MQYRSILKKDESRSLDISTVYNFLWVISKTLHGQVVYTTKFRSVIYQKAHYCLNQSI